MPSAICPAQCGYQEIPVKANTWAGVRELFILGHLGITAGLAFLIGALAGNSGSEGGGYRPDLRLAALGALLPDIIDPLLATPWIRFPGGDLRGGRLVHHSCHRPLGPGR